MSMKQISKIMGLSTALLMTTAADAGWKGNFLLGVEGGFAARDAELNLLATEIGAGAGQAGFAKNHADNGAIWGLLGGYQVTCNRLLLGMEASVSWQDFGERKNFHFVDATPEHYNIAAEHERDTVVGLTFRAGYKVTPWMMPYLRAGAETSNETIIFASNNFTAGTALGLEDSRRAYRFVGGAGLEFPLIHQAVLRLEYNYSSRGRGAAATGVVPVSLETISADIKPNQHAGLLALVWNFR